MRFGLGNSKYSGIVRTTCGVISSVLGPKYIALPKTKEEAQEAENMLYKKHGFPQYIGAIHGTHIIKQPHENSTDCINRKNQCSINVQIVCDFQYCFTDIVIK